MLILAYTNQASAAAPASNIPTTNTGTSTGGGVIQPVVGTVVSPSGVIEPINIGKKNS